MLVHRLQTEKCVAKSFEFRFESWWRLLCNVKFEYEICPSKKPSLIKKSESTLRPYSYEIEWAAPSWEVFLDFVMKLLLNQVHASCRLVHAWFLEIDLVREVYVSICVSVCPPLRLAITSGMIWYDMDPIWLVKQVLQLLYGSYSLYH